MWGATIPTEYYGFYDDPKLQARYCSVVSFLLSPRRRKKILDPGKTKKSDLFAGIVAGWDLFHCHFSPTLSHPDFPTISSRHVRSPGTVSPGIHLARHRSSRLGGAKSPHESGLNDSHGVAQSCRRSLLRLEGMYGFCSHKHRFFKEKKNKLVFSSVDFFVLRRYRKDSDQENSTFTVQATRSCISP